MGSVSVNIPRMVCIDRCSSSVCVWLRLQLKNVRFFNQGSYKCAILLAAHIWLFGIIK
jgi:hypothetical protein